MPQPEDPRSSGLGTYEAIMSWPQLKVNPEMLGFRDLTGGASRPWHVTLRHELHIGRSGVAVLLPVLVLVDPPGFDSDPDPDPLLVVLGQAARMYLSSVFMRIATWVGGK